MSLSEEALRELSRLTSDFPYYASRCLHIKAKAGAIIPFKLNAAQLYIHEKLEEQRATTGRIRALILKGRQQGCSTYVEGRFFWKVTQTEGVKAFILTHHDDATANIFGMAKLYFENVPPQLKPVTAASNKKELVFSKLKSGYAVGTAGSAGVGRSQTIQYFHGSEVAYWPHAETHVAGAMQAVPDAEGTEIILESTSAGAEGLFYTMAQSAMAGQGDYQLIFVPWFWQPEYRKKLPDNFSKTPEEHEYAQLYGIDDEQICWRRSKIIELAGVWNFRREYPATAKEAFLAEVPGALWKRHTIDECRVLEAPEMRRIVIAIDPAVTKEEASDETGIVCAGLGIDGKGYVLTDLSGRYSPAEWARRAIAEYHTKTADRIIVEVNNGGDMIKHTISVEDDTVAVKEIRASRGKRARAEPVAALYERGDVHHVGSHTGLEDQMCTWDAAQSNESPDRVDALVWALTELMLQSVPQPQIRSLDMPHVPGRKF